MMTINTKTIALWAITLGMICIQSASAIVEFQCCDSLDDCPDPTDPIYPPSENCRVYNEVVDPTRLEFVCDDWDKDENDVPLDGMLCNELPPGAVFAYYECCPSQEECDDDAQNQCKTFFGDVPRVFINDPCVLQDLEYTCYVCARAFGCADPHFMTWGGERYDYHGECDLVMLSAPSFANGIGLKNHIRTTARYDYSYISSTAIQIGDDVLEVESWGDYFLNGVNTAQLPAKLGGFALTRTQTSEKETFFTIEVGDRNISISSFKDMVNVKFDPLNHFEMLDSQGLFGEYPTGKMVGRDGKTVISEPNDFGQEWQVLETEPKLFQVNRLPQHPHQKCILPAEKDATKRRLGERIPQETAEKACSHWNEHKDMCVQDVLLTGDVDVAEMTHMFN